MRRLALIFLGAAAFSRAEDPPPLPPGVDPAPYAGRYPACDAEGVTGFADPCRCFCLEWVCMHWLFGEDAPLEPECAAEYIIGSEKPGNVFIATINDCIAVNCTARAEASPTATLD